MPKAETKGENKKRRDPEVTPHTRDGRMDRRQEPTATRHTSGRALASIYNQKSGPVGAGKGAGAPAEAGGATSIQARQATSPRVWNSNKPKIVKNYDVYAKQPPQSTAQKAAMPVREWLHPPYPVKRPKTNKNRGDRNYETFYVSLDEDEDDDDGGSSASSNDNAPAQPLEQGLFVALDNQEIPERRRQLGKGKADALKEEGAKRRKIHNLQEESQEGLKDEGQELLQDEGQELLKDDGQELLTDEGQELLTDEGQELLKDEDGQELLEEEPEQPYLREFPVLPPAGERYALKMQEEADQMASLIAEVQKIRLQRLAAQGGSQKEEEEEHKPPQLIRMRTQIHFSIYDCHPTVAEFARRLPNVPGPNAHKDLI